MADELQELYAEAVRRGMFKKDPELQEIGHEMRARGMVTDPTQGGLAPAAATGNKQAVGDLMARLLRGEHLAPAAAPPRDGASRVAPSPAGKPKFDFAAADPYSAIAAYHARRGPAALADILNAPGDTMRAAIAAAGGEINRLFHGQAPRPSVVGQAAANTYARPLLNLSKQPSPPVASEGVRKALGITPKTTPLARYPAAVADFLVGAVADPANAFFDPAVRAAGEAVAPVLGRGAQAVGRAAGRAVQSAPAKAAGRAVASAVDWAAGPGATAAVAQKARSVAAFAGLGPDAQKAAENVRTVLNGPGWRYITRPVGNIKRQLVNNPATQANNLVGNHIMSRLALGSVKVDPILLERNLPAALREVRDFLKNGAASPAITELAQHSNAFTSNFVSQGAASPAPAGKALRVAGQVVHFFGDQQDAAEKIYKVGLFKALRKGGLDPASAARTVDKYLFDYSDRSALLEVAERLGLAPFVTYPSKAAKVLFETIATRPDLVAKYPRVRRWLYANPEDQAAYKKLRPDDQGLFTIPVGGGEFLKLDRYNPLAGPIEAAVSVYRTAREGLPLRKTVRDLVARNVYGPIVLNLGFNQQALAENPDLPRRISNPGEPEKSRLPAHARELLKNYAPSLLGGRGYQAGLEAIRGQTSTDAPFTEPRTPADVALQYLLGMKGVKAEEKPARLQRLAPAVERRAAVAVQFYSQVLGDVARQPNPYESTAANLTPDEARRQLKATTGALKDLLTSGRVVNAHGQMTAEGRQRILFAEQYRQALVRRASAAR